MKKIVALVLALMLALSMLTVASAETANPVAGKKVAYIMLLPSATIFQMWKDSCADLCAALDVDFDFYFCDGDFNRWMDTINTCAAAGYDGLLVSHGNQDGSYVFLKELTEKYPELKLVCFDTQFYTDGEYQKIEGVTQLFQQDKSLVTVLLDEMIAKFGEGVRLIKVWRGPNYNSPFDRRQTGYQPYEDEGKIVTVEEHSVIGGLGSAVADVCAEKCPCLVKKIGVNDEFGQSGPAVDLLKLYGLSSENIVKTVKEVVGK